MAVTPTTISTVWGFGDEPTPLETFRRGRAWRSFTIGPSASVRRARERASMSVGRRHLSLAIPAHARAAVARHQRGPRQHGTPAHRRRPPGDAGGARRTQSWRRPSAGGHRATPTATAGSATPN